MYYRIHNAITVHHSDTLEGANAIAAILDVSGFPATVDVVYTGDEIDRQREAQRLRESVAQLLSNAVDAKYEPLTIGEIDGQPYVVGDNGNLEPIPNDGKSLL
jgi:hypothetical protein